MDQTEKPTSSIQQHPEEEEHHENGASKMFRKVKAKAKKFKNSITKHGQSHENDHDVVEEDDDDDELEPEVISAPVRSGVTGQPESLNHPRETNVPAPEEIVPPGTKVFPVVSSDYTKPIEPVPLQDTSYGHEALFDPVRTNREEKREEPTHHPLGVSELSDRGESREAHHEALNTPVSLLSETEDVTSTFAPRGEDDGQRKVNFETPKKLEEDSFAPGGGSDCLSGVSDYKSKVNDPTHEEDGVPEIVESLGVLKVSDDESSDQKFDRDLPTRSHEVDRETESAIGKDSPVSFGGKSGAEFENDLQTKTHEFDTTTESGIDKNSPSRSYEFDLETESGINKNSPAGFGGEPKTTLGEDSPTRSYGFDQKIESENVKNSPTGFGSELGDSPTRSYGFDQKIESENVKNSPTGFNGELGDKLREDSPTRSYESETNKNSTTEVGGASIVGLGEDFPEKSHELGLKNESESGKDFPMGFGGESKTSLGEDFPAKESHGYGEESEAGLEKNFPARSDDVKVEAELGRDFLPTETHDQFSPDISRPKERDDFEESRENFEETRGETEEPKQSTYTEPLDSKLGYSGESHVGDDTKVAGTFDEKLTPVNETGSTELPLSGGGSDLEEKQQQGEVEKGVPAKNYLAEKLTPGEEDKALSEVIAEKLNLGGGGEEEKKTTKEVEVEKIPNEKETEDKEHGEADTEEVKGGGMVGMIKGWFGGAATEEVKPKSPHSVDESSQSLGSTVGTTGFSDSGKSELGETGAVPVQRGLGN